MTAYLCADQLQLMCIADLLHRLTHPFIYGCWRIEGGPGLHKIDLCWENGLELEDM